MGKPRCAPRNGSTKTMASLNEAAKKALEELMLPPGYEPQSDIVRRWVAKGRAEGRAEGEAKGEAKAVLGFLEARGLVVTVTQRERILSCADADELQRWIRKAATVASADELFL